MGDDAQRPATSHLQEPAPTRPGLSDRATVLANLGRLIDEAWTSFDEPRVSEPELSAELTARLRTPLPEAPGEEEQALADALAATYDANLASAAGGAELIEQQTLEWLAQFVRFPLGEGTFTSGD